MQEHRDTENTTPECEETEKSEPQESTVDWEHQLTKGFAARFIRKKSRQLTHHSSFRRSEREDLAQDMTMRLIERLPQFDPAAGHWRAFVMMVVEQHLATMLESRRRLKRLESGRTQSLNCPIGMDDADPVSLESLVCAEDRDRRLQRQQRSEIDAVDFRLDVNTLIATLPADYQRLCELLKFRSVLDAAKELGYSRSTVYAMIDDLRALFKEKQIS